MPKTKSSSRPSHPQKQEWVICGKACPGRRFVPSEAELFKISFQAFSTAHAKSIALERLKAHVSRLRRSWESRKLMLQDVQLKNGSKEFALKGKFCNNSVLFAKRAKVVF